MSIFPFFRKNRYYGFILEIVYSSVVIHPIRNADNAAYFNVIVPLPVLDAAHAPKHRRNVTEAK